MTSRTDHFNQCESIVQTNMGCVKMLAMVFCARHGAPFLHRMGQLKAPWLLRLNSTILIFSSCFGRLADEL